MRRILLRNACWVGILFMSVGCTPVPRVTGLELARLPFHVDSARSEQLAEGVIHRYVYSQEGPWAIHILDIPQSSCIGFQAVKAHGTAAGREPATLLLEQLDAHVRVIAGVNADFFNLATGVPVSTHIEGGRLIAGPALRPVLAFDSSGKPFIGTLRANAHVQMRDAVTRVLGWNRVLENEISFIDRSWGAVNDSGSGRIEVALSPGKPYRVLSTDTLPAGAAIPPAGALLVAGRNAPDHLRNLMLSLRPGEAVQVDRTIEPFMPMEAVGGWPIILRAGAITGAVDSAGATFAPVRHPRTAAAIFPDGHLMLLVVDGRQKPFSDGMTLRELARVLQSLGAYDAVNLDGGGSSTFVIRDSLGVMQIQNRPSDKSERAVSNVLAVTNRCN